MNAIVIRGGALGDVVLTLPVLAALRGRGYRTTAAVGRTFGPLLREAGAADAWLPLDGEPLLPLFCGGDDAAARAILRPFDLVVAYAENGEPLERTLRRLVPADRLAVRPPPPERGPGHAADRLLSAVVPPEPRSRAPEIRLPDRRPAYVLIHPGSGSPGKNWPGERFAELAARLRGRTPVRILLGPAEAGGPAPPGPRPADGGLIRSFSPDTLMETLRGAAVFVGNDSGVAHLAAACGIPTIAVFGPTDPDVWGPRGRRVEILRGKVPCAPCARSARAACAVRRCLAAVPVAAVLAATERMLESHGETGRLHE